MRTAVIVLAVLLAIPGVLVAAAAGILLAPSVGVVWLVARQVV